MTDYFVIHLLGGSQANVYYCDDYNAAKDLESEITEDYPEDDILIARKVSKNGY